MKNTKKIISLLLTIQMLFACTLVPSAMATDSVVETPVVEGEESVVESREESGAINELQPMEANACHGETWTEPRNLTEQLALEAAMADPTIGVQLPITLRDPRWPSFGDGINISIQELGLYFTTCII